MRVCLLILVACAVVWSASPSYVVVDIRGFGWDKLSDLKDEAMSTIEIGDKLLWHGVISNSVENMLTTGAASLVQQPPSASLYLLSNAHVSHVESLQNDVQVLCSGQGFWVVSPSSTGICDEVSQVDAKIGCKPLESIKDLVLVRSAANDPPTVAPWFHHDIVRKMVHHVNPFEWYADLAKLASFNRYTLGSGIEEASNYLQKRFRSMGYRVEKQAFSVSNKTAYNLITQIGSPSAQNWVIIGGHYDSISEDPKKAAPGAEDNASGACAVLQFAKIFRRYPPPPDWKVIFILFSGEEQGLYGSIFNAQQIKEHGDASRVKLVHTMDMIAYQPAGDSEYGVLLETSSTYKSLFETYKQGATYVNNLNLYFSEDPFGSDHVPYIENGMPGILTIDEDWASYPYYHKTTDTANKVNAKLATKIIQLGVATAAVTMHMGK